MSTREQWLQAAVTELTPWIIEKAGRELPAVSVTVGWPSAGGLARKKRVIGQCWDGDVAEMGSPAVFISPVLGAYEALDVLTHELIHALVGCKARHKGPFAKACKQVGLVGKPTSNTAGPELKSELQRIMAKLGDYPHEKITPRPKEKTQTTRMIKCECELCGYVCRTTRKWIDDKGAPFCPCSIEAGSPVPMMIEDNGDSALFPEPEPAPTKRPEKPKRVAKDEREAREPVEFEPEEDEDVTPRPAVEFDEEDDGSTPACAECGEPACATRGAHWYCGEHVRVKEIKS